MKKLLIVVLSLTLTIGLNAQGIFSITDGQISTCNGTLFDSGGQGGTGYQNNENYTVTICPDNPNDVITLDFQSFNLSNVILTKIPFILDLKGINESSFMPNYLVNNNSLNLGSGHNSSSINISNLSE